MKDDDTPLCPDANCRAILEKAEVKLDDDNDIITIKYKCPTCFTLWLDQFNGKTLKYCGRSGLSKQ